MAAEKWMVYTKRADFQKIADEFGISPVTARIMRNRDVEGEEAVRRYLFGGIGDLYDPHLLKDVDLAVSILKEKIADGSAASGFAAKCTMASATPKPEFCMPTSIARHLRFARFMPVNLARR